MDFEAKAREVCEAMDGPMRRMGVVTTAHYDAGIPLIADALRGAALDDDARREAREALAGLLAEVKAWAVSPPALKWDPATQGPPEVPQTTQDPALGQAVSWGIVHHANPAVDVEAVAQAARAHGATFDGRTHEQALLDALVAFRNDPPAYGPSTLRGLYPDWALSRQLTRLLWILGLSEGERRFVTALAEDASDTVTAEVYADWLEENGRTAEGASLHRLAPRDGDVIVVRHPPGSRHEAHCATAKELADALAARGVRVWVVTMSDDMTLETAPSDAMRAAGWVRAEDVAGRLAYLARDLQARRDGRVDRAIALHFDDLFSPPAPGDAP